MNLPNKHKYDRGNRHCQSDEALKLVDYDSLTEGQLLS